MQKYKIVASKSQKKYTIILSADSEVQAKEKLHEDGYSILSISKLQNKDIEGGKFLFQVEKEWDIKNGIIVWEDIFKVYVKLIEELEYNVISLYPEWDEAHTNAEKKQKIIEQLRRWYDLQKKELKEKAKKNESERSFYLKKELDKTSALVEWVIEKFNVIFAKKQEFNIDEETFVKLEIIYEKLLHIKWSTNLVKLKEIWELALTKLAQIELESVEKNKTDESRKYLQHTNELLKELWSNRQFIEHDKDFKRIFIESLLSFKENFSSLSTKKEKKDKNLIDTGSYSFLKTVLLLEKYKEKLSQNSKEIRQHIFLFLNPFSKSEIKEKILLKRNVIKQNISILKAKKTWSISSYTSVKKWYKKTAEIIFKHVSFFSKIIFFTVNIYTLFFFLSLLQKNIWLSYIYFNPQSLSSFLLFFILFFLISVSKNFFILSLNIVFFWFLFIFSMVNF